MHWRTVLLQLRRCSTRKVVTKTKLSAGLVESVEESLKDNTIDPKHHPGVLKLHAVNLPEKYQNAIRIVMGEHPVGQVMKEGVKLAQHLYCRQPPVEEGDLRKLQADIEHKIEQERGIDMTQYDKETQDRIKESYKDLVSKTVKNVTYQWAPTNYSTYLGLQYLLGRACGEYAALLKIFYEIKVRCPDFKPESLFDFGSGVGTAHQLLRLFDASTFSFNCFLPTDPGNHILIGVEQSKVAERLWGSSLKEIYNVDTSKDMNDLADKLIRGGDENNKLPVKSVLYRQFLPAQHKIQYDIVVSAYSLLELPSYKSRLETVLNLWCKTQKYLVIVERGTNAGFKVINEARDFLLDLMSEEEEQKSDPVAHVFSPCPHDQVCPRYVNYKTPCHFIVRFYNRPFGKEEAESERYTYVVFQRGPRPADDPQWPRIVTTVLNRGRHSVCRMCTASGKLEEIIFTAKKHGKSTYRCARSSHWGDRLPVNFFMSERTIRDWSNTNPTTCSDTSTSEDEHTSDSQHQQ